MFDAIVGLCQQARGVVDSISGEELLERKSAGTFTDGIGDVGAVSAQTAGQVVAREIGIGVRPLLAHQFADRSIERVRLRGCSFFYRLTLGFLQLHDLLVELSVLLPYPAGVYDAEDHDDQQQHDGSERQVEARARALLAELQLGHLEAFVQYVQLFAVVGLYDRIIVLLQPFVVGQCFGITSQSLSYVPQELQ